MRAVSPRVRFFLQDLGAATGGGDPETRSSPAATANSRERDPGHGAVSEVMDPARLRRRPWPLAARHHVARTRAKCSTGLAIHQRVKFTSLNHTQSLSRQCFSSSLCVSLSFFLLSPCHSLSSLSVFFHARPRTRIRSAPSDASPRAIPPFAAMFNFGRQCGRAGTYLRHRDRIPNH